MGPCASFPKPCWGRLHAPHGHRDGPKGLFLKKHVFVQNKRTRILIFFFLVFIYVLLFYKETLPFYLYVMFSMASGNSFYLFQENKVVLSQDFRTYDKYCYVFVKYKQRFMIYKCHLFIDFFFFLQNPKRNDVGEGRLEPASSRKLPGCLGLLPGPQMPPTPHPAPSLLRASPVLCGEMHLDANNKTEPLSHLWHVD